MLTHTYENKHTHTDRCTNRQTLYAFLRVTQRKEEEEEEEKEKKKKKKKETKTQGALLDSACGCCKNAPAENIEGFCSMARPRAIMQMVAWPCHEPCPN